MPAAVDFLDNWMAAGDLRRVGFGDLQAPEVPGNMLAKARSVAGSAASIRDDAAQQDLQMTVPGLAIRD